MHIQGDAAAGADAFLPMAATCMNILKLPPYSDIGLCVCVCVCVFHIFSGDSAVDISCLLSETMRTKLIYAMNSNSGFFLA
jgi:hypothetical protein